MLNKRIWKRGQKDNNKQMFIFFLHASIRPLSFQTLMTQSPQKLALVCPDLRRTQQHGVPYTEFIKHIQTSVNFVVFLALQAECADKALPT